MTIAANLAYINERIRTAAEKAGRDPSSVRLVAVSKTRPAADIIAAFQAGQTVFGENYIQELVPKLAEINEAVQWHVIGHLQSNKVKVEIADAIFKRSAGSRTDMVQKTQARDLATAQTAVARANLEAAKINLSYTRIYAPIDGRIDRNFVDAGNLVGGNGQATLLATIVRHDPIYAYFTASERELLQYLEMQRQNRTVAPAGQRNAAYLGLVTDTGFPRQGVVDYAANKIDPQTGTIEIRAVFPNPDRWVIPGLFVRVRLPFTRENALLVPSEAVSADQGGTYLLVVDAKDTVQYRRARLGSTIEGGLQVVQEGIGPEDWVVVNGLQRARPGSVVKPMREPIQAPTPIPAAKVEPLAASSPTPSPTASAVPTP